MRRRDLDIGPTDLEIWSRVRRAAGRVSRVAQCCVAFNAITGERHLVTERGNYRPAPPRDQHGGSHAQSAAITSWCLQSRRQRGSCGGYVPIVTSDPDRHADKPSLITSHDASVTQSRLNVFGGPGPARLMGPYHLYGPGPRGGVRAIVLCTSESGNAHLGPNQGQTWCQITIYEMGINLL